MGTRIIESQPILTKHASSRMSARSINGNQIDQVMRYGRESHVHSAVIYAIGKKEVRKNGRFLEACEGIHVICSPSDGAIITIYRNHNLKSLRH
jgi:Domain of unknown function (DUF4258)